MKKSLIALAVAGAFAAPAFAATSNVDIYGKLHVSANYFQDQSDAFSDLGISSNASRIGFKGSEDLGGGLKAIWQAESSVNLDEGGGTWASRNSFIGLNGGWGTALLGQHDTPLKLVGRAVDLFGDTMADSRNVMSGAGDVRAKNVVAYISPSFSGFGFAAAYSTDPDDAVPASDEADNDVWNVSATYNNGPLYLGGAYSDGDAQTNLGLGAMWRVAAGFTFGNFKVVGQYDSSEADDNTLASDRDAWMVGGSYTMGAMVFKANYMEAEVDGCTAAFACEPEQWTVGMDYNLSKRTSVYALYSDGQDVVMGGGAGLSDQVSPAILTGEEDISVISLGVVHSF
jgi:predicted porin